MEVRVDKYLWAMRIYKTRSIAADACKNGRVSINGVQLKPSRTFHVGDTFNVRKGPITYTFRVLQLTENRLGAKLVPEYAENLTPQSELDKLHAPVETFFVRRERGAGRPTKKERRDIEALWEGFDPGAFDDE